MILDNSAEFNDITVYRGIGNCSRTGKDRHVYSSVAVALCIVLWASSSRYRMSY
ncbi:MAG: hypothetical protein WC067_03995 [Candidatus Methanomethylophilaceae archaeon]